ncbi:glycosyltransferase [Flavobacteriaceae bacterium 14752]|uniref:glycosyltransferase n=1 Tax=Mesohalobacter salilacus TaxID=2491711 RepID=UPI000F635833|nr:glycosyltransferase [Flavobacteriaceae bacterium 14752]
MVSVIMITYRHEKFIEQAIIGILNQQCEFEVELIIADDCSPDRTYTIVEKIKNKHINGSWIKYTRHKENKGMNKNFSWASKQCKGEYIAICEGDDYWIDENKLQKQVDFLEKNRSYGMVSGNINLINSEGFEIKNTYYHLPESQTLENGDLFWLLMNKNFIYTLTVCVRKELIIRFTEEAESKNLDYVYDYWFWLYISLVSKIKILKMPLANYRIHNDGVTKKLDFFSRRKDLVKINIIKSSRLYKNKRISKNQRQVLKNVFINYFRNRKISLTSKLKTLPYLLLNVKNII